jgi:cytochrome c553
MGLSCRIEPKGKHMRDSWIPVFGLGLSVIFAFVAVAIAPTGSGAAVPLAPATYPTWAYAWDPDFQVASADNVPQRLPGSTAAFSWVQVRDLFFSPSWHEEDHPAMPDVVARGRKPDVRACGSCHRAEGTGGPENSSLAGLSVEYFVQQMADYKSGARKSSGPQRASVQLMTASAKAITDAEVQAAAAYFAALKPKRIIKVVETDTVPKTYIARLFFVKQAEGGTEPLGRRIIEVPDDVKQFELRDTRSQFTAYVPVGSIAKGEALAKSGGGGTTVQCATCHGADLKGVGPTPGIAGRSPTYIVRQLYDYKHGARAGASSALMKPAVEKLSEDDMISLASYVASLTP